MALVVKDRIKVTAAAPGTGNVTLGSAELGYQTFAAIGNNNSTYYAIQDLANNLWEVGEGTFTTSGPTLARNQILSNSAGNTSAINFTAAVEVFVTTPATKSVHMNLTDDLEINGDVTFTSDNATDQVLIKNTNTGTSAAPDLVLWRDSSQVANADSIGRIDFRGEDDGSTARNYTSIESKIVNVAASTPTGAIHFKTLNASTSEADVLILSGNTATFKGDVTINHGSGATTGVLNIGNSNGNGTLAQINMGHSGDPDHGNISYTGSMVFKTGANATALTLDGSQNSTFAGGVDAATFFRAPNFYTGVGSQGLVNTNTNDLKLVSQSGDTHIYMDNDLAVELYHNNAKKLETTSSGVTITGAVTANNIVASGAASSFNSGGTNTVATFTSTDSVAEIQMIDNNGAAGISAEGNTFQVRPAGGVAKLSVDASMSTFATDVTIGGNNLVVGGNNAQPIIELFYDHSNGNDYKANMRLAGNDLEIRGSNGVIEFFTGAVDGDSSTLAVTIDSSNHAYFEGDVLINKHLRLRTTDDQATTWILYNHTDDTFRIDNSGGSDEFILHQNGNLDILGDIQAAGMYVGATNTSYDFYNNGTTYLNGAVTVDNFLTVSGTGAGVSIDGGTSNNGTDATLYVTATNNNDWGLIVNKSNGSATEYGQDIRVSGGASYAFRVVGGGVEKFRITGTGQVYSQSSIYATQFVDIDSSSYLVNPASASNMDVIQFGGQANCSINQYSNDLTLRSHDDMNLKSRWIRMYSGPGSTTSTSGTTEYARISDTGNWFTGPMSFGGNNSGSSFGSNSNPGTSGQVLTSQGNATAPTWADAGGSGWEHVTTYEGDGTDLYFEITVERGYYYKVYFWDVQINNSSSRNWNFRFNNYTNGLQKDHNNNYITGHGWAGWHYTGGSSQTSYNGSAERDADNSSGSTGWYSISGMGDTGSGYSASYGNFEYYQPARLGSSGGTNNPIFKIEFTNNYRREFGLQRFSVDGTSGSSTDATFINKIRVETLQYLTSAFYGKFRIMRLKDI
jgi:hypothetical protein